MSKIKDKNYNNLLEEVANINLALSDDCYKFPKEHIKKIEREIALYNQEYRSCTKSNNDIEINEEIQNNIINYENILENDNRNKEEINVIYNNLVELYKKESKRQGYTSYLDYHNYINGNKKYDSKRYKYIEGDITHYSNVLKSFYKMYSKKVNNIHPYDLNNARIANKIKKVDVYKDVIKPLRQLDVNFYEYIYNLYKEGYIVVQHNKLIQEAFFLDLPFSKKVYIYASLSDDLDDYFYLVHEIGHAYHSYLNMLNGVSDSSLEVKEYMAHNFELIFIKNNCDKHMIDIYKIQTISAFLWEVVLFEYQSIIFKNNRKYKDLITKNNLFLSIIKRRTHKIYSDTNFYDNDLDYMWIYETSLFKSPFYNLEYIYSKIVILDKLDDIYNIDSLYEDYIKILKNNIE